MDQLWDWMPTLVALAVVIALLVGTRKLFEGTGPGAQGGSFRSQIILLGLSGVGMVVVILLIPDSDRRGQLLSLFGLGLTAAIALSATTFVGNAMAGVMIRAVQSFRRGDFIQVGEHFGRVTEADLLHTEIQTEDRDLTTLPNLYLVTNPVKVVRPSGTILSATVSLGYDVDRGRIQEALLQAAERAGLAEPFVQVLELGDYSVTYRIAGLQTEVKQILTARSRLRGEMMDSLHEAGIEIVSPTFMNQRPIAGQVFVPESQPARDPAPTRSPESLIFDKAEQAESIEILRTRYKALADEIAEAEASTPADDEEAVKRIELQRAKLEKLATAIEERESSMMDEEEG